jgi:hypothetical protein
VQAREGFPRGAAPNDAELKATLRSEQTSLRAQAAERLIPLQEHRASIIRPLIEGGMTPGQARAEYARQFPEMDADFNKLWAAETGDGRFTGRAGYNRVAGEVEARDVQSRADFAPDQRAATAPYTSQGIAPEDMIVLNRGGGVQESRTGTFTLDYFGTPVRILQNPTPQQARGFMDRTKYKAARRIVDPETGDTFIWDANDPALHAMVAEQLGIKPGDKTIMDMIGID